VPLATALCETFLLRMLPIEEEEELALDTSKIFPAKVVFYLT
jgi:hypothetical protein